MVTQPDSGPQRRWNGEVPRDWAPASVARPKELVLTVKIIRMEAITVTRVPRPSSPIKPPSDLENGDGLKISVICVARGLVTRNHVTKRSFESLGQVR